MMLVMNNVVVPGQWPRDIMLVAVQSGGYYTSSSYYHITFGTLTVNDYLPPLAFCRWFRLMSEDGAFAASILFTDEAWFGRDSIRNNHNAAIIFMAVRRVEANNGSVSTSGQVLLEIGS